MLKIKNKLKNLPKVPGVYQFLDKNGAVIYVGKAKNLRARVAQYFGHDDSRPQIPYLMAEATDLDYTIVSNELESLFLENTLIKQYSPKYNIDLKDDKNYAFITIDYSTEIPQIGYARRVEGTGKKEHKTNTPHPSPLTPKYFGPYSAAYKIRNTLNLVRRIFPYCAAKKVGMRPCFYYYMHRCPGVCVGKISLDDYKRHLEKIVKFLRGNAGTVLKEIKNEMRAAAKSKKFEAAARLRDQLRALKILREKQNVILAKKVDWDIVSISNENGFSCVNLFKIREGKMFDKESFVYELPETLTPGPLPLGEGVRLRRTGEGDVLQRFLEQYYLETSSVPKVIYTEFPPEDGGLIKQIIKSRFNRAVEIATPQKGKIARLINLGKLNAEEYLKHWLNDKAGNLDKINKALEELKQVLGLPTVPKRIECYDISNIQGINAVGSMVVFVNGLPKKSEYRKFRIRSKSTPDDFAMMKEMLTRRFAHSVIARSADDEAISSQEKIATPQQAGARNDKQWPMPDLIVIDGGKGQLNVAVQTINNLRLTINVIGLAKRIEDIFVLGKKDPIILPHDNPALQLLQRLRDEAHRFGITFHRAIRSKQAVKSALDDIPGVGPKTKKLLKAKFGTVANIRKTKSEDLAATVGKHIAELIQQSL